MLKNQRNVSLEDSLTFLNMGIEKTRRMIEHLDNQLNIIIGISTAIFVFAASSYTSKTRIEILILAVFASCSACIGLVGVRPFKFMRKRKGLESVFYNKYVTKEEQQKYIKRLKRTAKNREAILEQYAIEIYNPYNFYYQPKRNMYRLARNLLLLGIFLALFIFSIGVTVRIFSVLFA